jgi:uncharacterized membrane protein
MKRSILFHFFAATVLLALSPLLHAQATYRLQQIGPDPIAPEVYFYWVDDLNDKGEVVGGAYATEGLWNYVWRRGNFTRLPGLPNEPQTGTSTYGINNLSRIIGWAPRNEAPFTTNVIWANGQIRDIGGDFLVRDMNSWGFMVGNQEAGTSVNVPMMRFGTFTQQMEALPGATYSLPTRLNELGMSTGYSQPFFGRNHAVMWTWTQVYDIVLPADAYDSEPGNINNFGAVALRIRFDEGASARAAMWQDGQLTQLPAISAEATFSGATGINDAGQVVGDSGGEGVIWQNGAVYRLDDLVSPSDPLYGSVHFTRALFINNRGQIVAEGVNANFTVNYLLTPTH